MKSKGTSKEGRQVIVSVAEDITNLKIIENELISKKRMLDDSLEKQVVLQTLFDSSECLMVTEKFWKFLNIIKGVLEIKENTTDSNDEPMVSMVIANKATHDLFLKSKGSFLMKFRRIFLSNIFFRRNFQYRYEKIND